MHSTSAYLTIFATILLQPISPLNNNTLLLLISFDGFRPDYLERNLSNAIVELRKNSSYPPYMLSVFPTKTFPNHFSIATGMYTEVHGVLDNELYNNSTNSSLKYGYELFHYNKDIVPLWVLNEKGGGGRRSGCMMYPGCDFEYQDTVPSYHMSYNKSVKWHHRVDILLSWFEDPDKPINLGMLYFEEPDLLCHHFGPDSEEVNGEITHVDQVVQYLLKKTAKADLLKELNIVFLSDHGGQAVKYPENIIDLDKFISRTWYIRDGVTPTLQIYPLKDKDIVLEALRGARTKGGNFSVFTHNDMLERWHYKDCARTPPILLVADTGFLFTGDEILPNSSSTIGTHGYDPLEVSMRAFFMAMGPLFKKNHTIEPFENINIYPLAAHILGLTLPELKPNGSLHYLQGILVEEISLEHKRIIVYVVLIAGVICSLSTIICIKSNKNTENRKSSTASYVALNQENDDEGMIKPQDVLTYNIEEDSPT